MAKFYSKSTCGFYDDGIHKVMPSDAVGVSDEDYSEIFIAQSSGKVIQADASGNPKAIMPILTQDQIRKILSSHAQFELNKSDVTIMRCLSADPVVAIPAAWTTYRSALRDIVNGTDTTSTSLPSVPAYPAGT